MQPYECLACGKRHDTQLAEFRCMYGAGLISAKDAATAFNLTTFMARRLMEGGDPYALKR